MYSEYILSHCLCPPLPPAVEETEARGAADVDRNQLTDIEQAAALPTDGLHIPAKGGGLGATGSGGGDEIHGQK